MYDPYKHWQYLLYRQEKPRIKPISDLVSRVRCRIFGLHDFTCRGRRDHSPERGHWLS